MRPRSGLVPTSVVAAVASLLVAATLAACSGSGSEGGTEEGGADRPNIVFIVADDMAVSDLVAMPELQRWMGEEGTAFERFYVSVSLCCPSRTTMLRGQYAHNTGVESNEGTNGGFPVVYERDLETSTIATWLEAEGYRTGLFGKYLNLYPNGVSPSYVPPGWGTWFSPVGTSEAGFDYLVNDDGRLVAFGDEPEDYAPAVYVDRVAALAEQAEAADEPFFAWLAVDAPHEPAAPAPQDVGAHDDEVAPRGEAFDRVDPSAPAWVRDLPPLTEAQLEEIDDRHRDRLASLRSLDRELARLADLLDERGQLDDTYVVFTSDNGFHLGQHRLKAGKQSAYEEDVRVPFLVRGPGVAQGAVSEALVANVDVAPTFAALAGAEAPDFVDGRSLVGLWHGDAEADAGSGRTAVLLEHWPPVGQDFSEFLAQEASSSVGTPAAAAAPGSTGGSEGSSEGSNESEGGGGDGNGDAPVRREGPAPYEYVGVRTDRYTYVEYVTGEIELYDNVTDPAQIRNIAASADPALLERLAALVDELEGCAGESCRSAEAVEIP
ncbi:MAG: sulfatase [Acidimicrobiales bacterium]|nr:sulfatase [Acidimicrobiales bacterium]